MHKACAVHDETQLLCAMLALGSAMYNMENSTFVIPGHIAHTIIAIEGTKDGSIGECSSEYSEASASVLARVLEALQPQSQQELDPGPNLKPNLINFNHNYWTCTA